MELRIQNNIISSKLPHAPEQNAVVNLARLQVTQVARSPISQARFFSAYTMSERLVAIL